MRTPTRTIVAGAALAALTLSAAACTNGGGDNTTTPTPPGTSAPPASTTSLPGPSPEDQAIAAAKEVVPEFFSMGDRALQDTQAFKPSSFKQVAIATALTDLQNRHSAFAAQKLKQVGGTTVESVTNPRVDLANDLKKSPPDVPTVQLDVCIDVSELNVVDESGESVVPADRKPRQAWRVGVSNYEYPKPGAWRVSYTDPQGGKTC